MGESGPEKAGVGGSIPSLATCFQSLAGTPNSDLVPIGPKTLTQTSLGLVSRAFHSWATDRRCPIVLQIDAFCCMPPRTVAAYWKQTARKTERPLGTATRRP